MNIFSYVGQDVSSIMFGKTQARVRNGSRYPFLSELMRIFFDSNCYSYIEHSQYAIQLIMEMRIGQLQAASSGGQEMAVLGSGELFSFHAASSLHQMPPNSASGLSTLEVACM